MPLLFVACNGDATTPSAERATGMKAAGNNMIRCEVSLVADDDEETKPLQTQS